MTKNTFRPYGDFSGRTYTLQPITHKQIRADNDCNGWLISKIINFARGSIYSMNAKSADCYAFTIDDDSKSWGGGWDWAENLVSEGEQYIYKFDDNRFYKIIINK